MSSRQVTCTDCGVALPDHVTQAAEAREPCPNCGSLARTMLVALQGSINISATVTAQVEVASATVSALDARVETTNTPPTTGPELTSTGLEVAHRGQIKWAPLDNGTWVVEVAGTGGEIKTGIADNDLPDALLNMIEYLLPSDHPEYPKD